MVEKFKEILQEINNAKGPVTLFAIMKMDELTDKWSVILSAFWATEENRDEMFTFVREILAQKLTTEEKSNIARIGIFPTDDHVTQLFLQFKKDTFIKEDTKINGFLIHEAYILESNSKIKPS